MIRHLSRSRLVVAAGAFWLALPPSRADAQAVSVGGGVGMLGAASDGYVGQVVVSYDAPLRGRSRWWASLHAGRDPNPGVASPGLVQPVTELVVALGPMLSVRGPGASTFFLGGGLYGVARRYGTAQVAGTGAPVSNGTRIVSGGDWGAVGRTALQLGDARRLGVLLDAQWRYAYEGSIRRLQPAYSIGLRRAW